MAYATSGLHQIASSGPSGAVWVYETLDAAATVIAAGYLSDAQARGVRVGDLLIIRQFASAAYTGLTAQSLHSMTTVNDAAGTTAATAALAGSGSYGVLSGAGDPDKDLDNLDGVLVGTVYVNTTKREPYIAVSNATGGTRWLDIGNDVIISEKHTLVSGARTMRFYAPFTGRIVGVRAVVASATTTGTAKAFTLSVSGVSVATGGFTVTKTQPPGTKFTAAPTTGNSILPGQIIALVGAAAAMSASRTLNIQILCRRRIAVPA